MSKWGWGSHGVNFLRDSSNVKAPWCWAENDDVKKIKIQLPKNNGGYKNFT